MIFDYSNPVTARHWATLYPREVILLLLSFLFMLASNIKLEVCHFSPLMARELVCCITTSLLCFKVDHTARAFIPSHNKC